MIFLTREIIKDKGSKLELTILHDWVQSTDLELTKRSITKVFNKWRKTSTRILGELVNVLVVMGSRIVL